VKLECFKSVVTCGNLSCVCVVVFFVYNIKILMCNVKKLKKEVAFKYFWSW
jgi:hypothetical protein